MKCSIAVCWSSASHSRKYAPPSVWATVLPPRRRRAMSICDFFPYSRSSIRIEANHLGRESSTGFGVVTDQCSHDTSPRADRVTEQRRTKGAGPSGSPAPCVAFMFWRREEQWPVHGLGAPASVENRDRESESDAKAPAEADAEPSLSQGGVRVAGEVQKRADAAKDAVEGRECRQPACPVWLVGDRFPAGTRSI